MSYQANLRILVLISVAICVLLAVSVGAAAADDVTDDEFLEDDSNSSAIVASSADEDDDDDGGFGIQQDDDDVVVYGAVSPPGDSFAISENITVWVGADDGSDIPEPVEGEELEVTIESDELDSNTTKEVETDENGSAHVTFSPEEENEILELAEEIEGGEFTFEVAQVDGDAIASAGFRIGPVVDIMNNRFDSIFIDDEVTYSFLVRDGEFGATNEEVDITIEGPEDEPVVDDTFETDENGFVEVDFVPEAHGDYVIDAELESSGDSDTRLASTTNYTVGTSEFADFSQAIEGEDSNWGGYLRDADGQVSNKDITVTLSDGDDLITETNTTTNENGFFLIDYEGPEDTRTIDVQVDVVSEDGIEAAAIREGSINVNDAPEEPEEPEEPDPAPELDVDVDVGSTAGSGTVTGPSGEVEITINAEDEDGDPIENEPVDLFVEWDFGSSPPLFADEIMLDEDGDAQTNLTVPENALDDVTPQITANLEMDDPIDDTTSFDIEKYDIGFVTPFDGYVPGEETQVDIEVNDQVEEEPVSDVPLQLAVLDTVHSDNSYSTQGLVSNDTGVDTATFDLPGTVAPAECNYNYVTRYTATTGNRCNGVDRGTLLFEGEELGEDITASPGEEIEVGFDSEVASSGLVHGEADALGFSTGSFGSFLSSEEDNSLTIPEYAEDGQSITLEGYTADENSEFYRNEVFGAIQIEEPEETTAEFDFSPDEPIAGENVTFDASQSISESGELSYTWEFIDGEVIETEEPVVEYAFDRIPDGTFDVTLTVEDEEGNTDNTTQSISVEQGVLVSGELPNVDSGLVEANLHDEEGDGIGGDTTELGTDGTYELAIKPEELDHIPDNAEVDVFYYDAEFSDERFPSFSFGINELSDIVGIDTITVEEGEEDTYVADFEPSDVPDGHVVDISVTEDGERADDAVVGVFSNDDAERTAGEFFDASELNAIADSETEGLELQGEVFVDVWESEEAFEQGEDTIASELIEDVDEPQELNIELGETIITGEILDADGDPVSNSTVELISDLERELVQTNESGVFEIQPQATEFELNYFNGIPDDDRISLIGASDGSADIVALGSEEIPEDAEEADLGTFELPPGEEVALDIEGEEEVGEAIVGIGDIQTISEDEEEAFAFTSVETEDGSLSLLDGETVELNEDSVIEVWDSEGAFDENEDPSLSTRQNVTSEISATADLDGTEIDGELIGSDGEPVDEYPVTGFNEDGEFEASDDTTTQDGEFSLQLPRFTGDIGADDEFTIGYVNVDEDGSISEKQEEDVDLFAIDSVSTIEESANIFEELPDPHTLTVDVLEDGDPVGPGEAVMQIIHNDADSDAEVGVTLETNEDGALQLEEENEPGLGINGTVDVLVFDEENISEDGFPIAPPSAADRVEVSDDEQLIFDLDAGERIEPEVDEDAVDLFDRSPFTLRYDDSDAATTVSVDDVVLDPSGSPDGSLNRSSLSVFDIGTQVEFEYANHVPEFVDITDIELDEGQLVVSKFEESLSDRDDLEDALSLQGDNADSYEIIGEDELLDIADGATVPFTPDESGQYIVHLVGVDEGDGFELVNEELNLDGNVEVLGVEQLAVQATEGNITPESDTVEQTDELTVEVDSQLDADEVDHALVAYDADKLAEREFILDLDRDVSAVTDLDEDEITLKHDIKEIRGVGNIDEDFSVFDMVGMGVESSSFSGTVSSESVFDFIFNQTDEVDRIEDEIIVDDDEAVVLDVSVDSEAAAGSSTELTIETLRDTAAGDYELLYVAQQDDDLTTMSTATDEIEVEPVEELPELQVDLDADDEQQLGDEINATATVENTGLNTTGQDVPINLTVEGETFGTEESITESVTDSIGELDEGESEEVEFDLTDIVTADGDERPDEHVVGDIELDVEVDPDEEITQLQGAENTDDETVEITYAKLEANAIAPSFAGEAAETTLRADVTNVGTASGDSSTFNVTVENESGEVVFEETDEEISTIADGERNRTRFTEAFTDTEEHTFTVEVDDDLFPGDSNVSVDQFEVEEYELELLEDRVRVPDERTAGQNITTLVGFETNIGEDVNTSLTLDTEGDVSENITFTDDPGAIDNTTTVDPERNRAQTVRFDVWALNESEVELEFEVEDTIGLDESETITQTLNLSEGAETISNTSSLAVEGASTDTDDVTVFGTDALPSDENLVDQDVELTVQAGADGRTLQGLEYLVQFPFGCVEQTTSAFLGALNTDEYYQDRDEDIADRFQDRINGSIAEGVERVTQGGERGQITEDTATDASEVGAWNQWGPDRGQGQEYFTAYSLFGLASVENFDRQGERDGVQEDLMNADYDAAINWFHQNKDDVFGEPATFGAGDGYLDTDEAIIGFSLIGIDEANQTNRIDEQGNLTEIYAAAADTLIDEEEDGYWADGDQRSTAHSLHGLKIAYDNGAYDEGEKGQVDYEEAIANATSWLVDNQASDGSWDDAHRSFGFQQTGDISETTASTMLALNASIDESAFDDDVVLPRTNDSLQEGVDFLVETYESDGSWGYPRATQAAINTLTELQPDSDEQTVDITIEGDEGNDLEIEDITVDASNQIEEVDLTDSDDVSESELEAVFGDDDGTVEFEIEVDGEDDGIAIVALEIEQNVRTSVLGGDDE